LKDVGHFVFYAPIIRLFGAFIQKGFIFVRQSFLIEV